MSQKFFRQLKEEANWTCSYCADRAETDRQRRFIHVHHRDRNRTNNDVTNLEIVCSDCHWMVHRGTQWDAANKCWDTSYNRAERAFQNFWNASEMQRVEMLVPTDIARELQTLADQQAGGDIGKWVTWQRRWIELHSAAQREMDGDRTAVTA